jgi:hypothetical protein
MHPSRRKMMRGARIVPNLRRSPRRKKRRKRLWILRRRLKRVSAHIFCLGSEGVRPFGVILGNEVGQRWGDMKLLIQNAASVLDSDDPKDP